MVASSKKTILKSVRQRRYLNKSFDGFRADLLDYAQQYYADRIQDFSEASLGGMFLDLASYVGDSTSFYLDHQFGELDVSTAVEDRNIERHLRGAGVEIVGASPAIATVTFSIEVPAATVGTPGPRTDILPIIIENTTVLADNGTQFLLIENLDFSEVDVRNNLIASVIVGQVDKNGKPLTYILSLDGVCISGFRIIETFQIPVTFVPFRQISLSNPNVSDILSCRDSAGNDYYEVTSLVQDTVFKAITNRNSDNDLVNDSIELAPAPYRFIKQASLATRFTTLTFGGGSAQSFDDDVIPDPTDFSIPLYGKKTFSRFTIDPNQLLKTRTLGVAATGVSVTVDYRYGGGLNHNVPAGSIRSIGTLTVSFPSNPSAAIATAIRSSLTIYNNANAAGGDDPPSINDLKGLVPSLRNAQARIVTKPDLLARIYTLPTNFGRVFRAGIRPNDNNPLATQLFILSQNDLGQLVLAPDTLKKNLAIYLNQFRMISDSIDMLDGVITNIQVEVEIVADPQGNKPLILQNILKSLRTYFNIKNFQIDEPIALSDIENLAFNTQGVISINTLRISNISGTTSGRVYSDVVYDIDFNTIKRLVIPPAGGIFEVKFPDVDIIAYAL